MSERLAADAFGLSQRTVTQLCGVLANVGAVERVVLYGSRAKGTNRPGSDIDLTLFGDDLTDDDLRRLMIAVDDLMLPYKVDLSLYKQINNDALRDHIDRVGVELYRRA